MHCELQSGERTCLVKRRLAQEDVKAAILGGKREADKSQY